MRSLLLGLLFFVLAARASAGGQYDKLYIGNVGNNSITVYNHGASGNTPPLYVIQGSKTLLSNPGQLSQDASGNLYVLNRGVNSSAILEFAYGAHGNVVPIRVIYGSKTNLTGATAMIVDKATGNMYAFVNSNSGYAYGVEFGPAANGNVAPSVQTINAFYVTAELAFNSSDQNLIYAHAGRCCKTNDGIDTVSKSFSSLYPIYNFITFNFVGIADDAFNGTYLSSNPAGIYRYPEAAKDQSQYVSIINDGCSTSLATALGPYPNTYAVHPGGGSGACAYTGVWVYTEASALLRVLSGPSTLMNQPFGIVEGS